MKKIIIILGIVLLMVIAYFTVSVYNLNKEEVYYGVMGDNARANKLVSEEDDVVYNYHLSNDDNELKKGDWVKIEFTENRGTILKQEVIEEEQVPKEIRSKYKSIK